MGGRLVGWVVGRLADRQDIKAAIWRSAISKSMYWRV